MNEKGSLNKDRLKDSLPDLQRSFTGSLYMDAPLGPLTSLKVGGPAAVLAEARTEDDLLAVAKLSSEQAVPFMVLGRGSNVLFSDEGFDGVVIRLGREFEWIRGMDSGCEAGGSTPLPQLSNWAARRSLTGLEFAVAIPASVGGAVRMNAGAHRSEIRSVLTSARICRLDKAEIDEVPVESLGMTYRASTVGPEDVVCSAVFRLKAGDRRQILELMKRHRQHRLTTQPADHPNAGSFFKNPEGASAGALIESQGLKGFRVGGAEVSTRHANFLVTHPAARAQDVYDLIAAVQSKVLKKAGILLVPEVRLVGRFETARGEVRFS